MRPRSVKMFLNMAMICRARTSCRQSSPTLKMAACQTSKCILLFSCRSGSSITVSSKVGAVSSFSLRTLKVAMKGA